MKKLLLIVALNLGLICHAQDTLNVLFLGNSYTFYNQLPNMVREVAASVGDVVTYSSNTPGGYRFSQHVTDATSLNLIGQGNWDYVVLQEQSQLPSFPINQVEQDVFPYAKKLDSLITAAKPCTETVFYNTWGRKNGDASNCGFFPPLCTYQGMDSLLQMRYKMMADSNDAIIGPVAQVWRYIRTNYPTIELYNADQSHPSTAGSYAAACAFYTVMFRKSPLAITYLGGLDSTTAANIRLATKLVAFDNLADWNVGKYDPQAAFTYSNIDNCGVQFTSNSQNADSYLWLFGDGQTSNQENPLHIYPNIAEIYQTSLIVSSCGRSDSIAIPVVTCLSGIDENTNAQVKTYPNPFTDKIAITSELPGKLGVWQLLNAQGQLVQSGSLNNQMLISGLGNLPKGLYLLRLQVGDKAVVKRVIKG